MKDNEIQQGALNLIYNRRTIRAYKAQRLTQEEITIIIKAAMRAPTAGNLMLYTILEVKEQELKDRLAITCDNQPHIAKAPLVLIFLADMQRWWDWFEMSKVDEIFKNSNQAFETPQESDLLLACCDALIAAQNAVIAAEALGIGSCYIGDIMENIEIHREMFKLPPWVFPITMLCFGYPKTGKEKIPLHPRFPEKFIHFINTYKRLNIDEFMEMFHTLKGRYDIEKIEDVGKEVYSAKMASKFTVEMRRSVKVALKEWNSKPFKGGL